ncbi:MAG: glycogen debranching enzyme N-terminal domain-containing protein [Sulfolobus sp.]|nr:glycogen debranching enzyme N-terminal domain-containing protein [Sulfolobus sp.]
MKDLYECLSGEWLLSFGTGGYASSTLCGINERTYHGYMVVPVDGTLGRRYLLLSKVEDFFIDDKDISYPMSTNHYVGDVYYPSGYKFIKDIKVKLSSVRWIYEFDRTTVIKTLFTFYGYNSILLSYQSSRQGSFNLCPLIGYRSHHLVMRKEGFFDYMERSNDIIITYNNYPFLHVKILSPKSNYVVMNTRYWYYNFFYKFDFERGTNYKEDLFNPFCIRFEKTDNVDLLFYYKEEPSSISEISKLQKKRLTRESEIINILEDVSQAFVVKTNIGWSMVAGYHWFDEWGRDTFISLEGLLLMQKKFDPAREIIFRYLDHMERGLVPNNFLPNGEPLYLGVDVSLWLVNSVYAYYNYTHDVDFITKIFPSLLDIIESYWKGNGTVFNNNYLIYHKGAPRTWMDAEVDGKPVTPREGASVEINALMYNALNIVNELNSQLNLGYNTNMYINYADKLKKKFFEKFINNSGYLFDYIDWNGNPNNLIRPNQLFAISLPFSIIEDEILARSILRIVEESLLRPLGISTLAKNSPGYTPYYRGDKTRRDLAYHNGVIWPWLLGAYIDAKIKFEKDKMALRKLIAYFDALVRIAKQNLGYIPELFEDIPPYNSGGCIAQAWSVAEFYRGMYKLLVNV